MRYVGSGGPTNSCRRRAAMNWCQARPRDSVFGRARQEARTNLLMAGRQSICFAPLRGAGAGHQPLFVAVRARSPMFQIIQTHQSFMRVSVLTRSWPAGKFVDTFKPRYQQIPSRYQHDSDRYQSANRAKMSRSRSAMARDSSFWCSRTAQSCGDWLIAL